MRVIPSALVIAVALALYFAPAPAGALPGVMHAAALIAFAVGMWAFGALPEHIVGLLFLLGAVLTAAAPVPVIFSGFASSTLWLVFGGLIIAEGVRATGLGERIARLTLERFSHDYARALTATVAVAMGLNFVMPATVARVLLLIPILTAVARRMGFQHGSRGYHGILLAAMLATYQCGTAVLPANAPNMVLAGAAETLYGVTLTYGEYLWVQFPVMGLVKGALIVLLALWVFPATPAPRSEAEPLAAPGAAEWRMLAILGVSLVLWATDFLHRVQPGWIALGAGLACVLPGIGVMPVAAFNDRIRFGPYFYIGAILGMGALMQESGLSRAIGDALLAALALRPGEDARNFLLLALTSTLTGLATTNPAQPALLAPIADHIAQAAGWPIKTVLMVLAVGFTTVILPYQVPPVMVGLQVAGIELRETLRFTLLLALASVLLLVPLDCAWWFVIGYFGK
ncbi:MAG TPA: SLC13 family permease [Burkholderiales bacterium]|nr:SLC13 family permease [Burkholderiales bacterium]